MKWIKITAESMAELEDGDNCLWAKFPVCEPPYCGSAIDVDFPGVHQFTHFFKLTNDFFTLASSPDSYREALEKALEKVELISYDISNRNIDTRTRKELGSIARAALGEKEVGNG